MNLVGVARLSTGTMLRAQDRAESLIGAAVKAEADRAAAEVARKTDQRRLAALSIILAASGRMVPAITVAVVRSRAAARADAASRLSQELSVIGVAASGLRSLSGRPLMVGLRKERESEDGLHAKAAGESLSSQWRGATVANVLAAFRRDEGPANAISRGVELVKPSIQRTAHSETAQAYNSEHAAALRDAVRYDSDLADRLAEAHAVREWSAAIDACHRCWPHHGEQVDIDESFSGGDEPGSVHARCRCIEFITSGAAHMRGAA